MHYFAFIQTIKINHHDYDRSMSLRQSLHCTVQGGYMLPQVVEETPQFNKSAWEGDRGRQRTLLFYQPQVLSIAV